MARIHRTLIAAALTAVLALTSAPWDAHARISVQPFPDLPVLGPESRRGGGLAASALGRVDPTEKVVDGAIDDWTGHPTRLGGTAVYSRGEYVYQDYLFDDRGADDGQDAQRLAVLDPLAEAEPRTYRADALAQALGSEFGAPGPETVAAEESYGDALYPQGVGREADLVEARVAADANDLFVLARTGAMSAPATAIIVLFDTTAASGPVEVGFGSGVTTTEADLAVFAGPEAARFRDLRTGEEGSLHQLGGASATKPGGYTNAIEISVPRTAVVRPDGTARLTMATGLADAAGTGFRDVPEVGANLFNAAFRFTEPVRVWMDKRQALTLLDGTVDPFLTEVELLKLEDGTTETFQPRPGYYERVFRSTTPGLAVEGGLQGEFQHYGLYLPGAYRPDRDNPATFWLHWRGGKAHSAGAWTPGVFRHLGEDRGNIVVSPSARGTSTWYLGRGHADFLEVWDDLLASLPVDRDRIYVSGYSMGGFGSYLLGLMYPDRFAASFPIVGPPTCGGWLGAGPTFGVEECRSPGLENEEENATKLLTFNVLENARNLPYVIFQGTNDELVWYPGVTRQALRLAELGYRYRLYTFPGYEHYTFALVDEWVEGAAYLDRFVRDPSPQHVTYRMSPVMEEVVETVQTNGTRLDFRFDEAYWVSGLRAADPGSVGTVDAETLGFGGFTHELAPEAGVVSPLGHSTPYVMHGLRWERGEPTPAENRFTLQGENIAAARLDLPRMGLGTAERIAGQVSTDGALELALRGAWTPSPTVLLDGQPLTASYGGGVLHVAIPAGQHLLEVIP